MKSIILPLLLLSSLNAQTLEGLYKTQSFLYIKSSFVEFFKLNGKYYAYAIANENNSPPRKDSNNPNPNLRNRSDKGVVFLYNLVQTAPNTYENGKVYNFYDGRTYYVTIHQEENGDLDFFVSIYKKSIIGKSFLWKHIDDKSLEEKHIKKPDFNEVLKTISQINP
ncbi:hypothetical protein BKH41_09225 [Helicobacter sp. 12S02232-10]|uniref:DUF2147 domain-containing protein n=1 Tax=Helicobacter sp. 12S02232-10 TaxID=1476197 RepID=UPI000BA760A3|nr:DUF2147 domain-containing protein [Helicobacter sp. 12S02232-10]PAF46401.1 hypothetical protein BKH41_09225 [Helicobacter sp. 12S02232-10]